MNQLYHKTKKQTNKPVTIVPPYFSWHEDGVKKVSWIVILRTCILKQLPLKLSCTKIDQQKVFNDFVKHTLSPLNNMIKSI